MALLLGEIALVLAGLSAPARADMDHAGMSMTAAAAPDVAPASAFTASLAAIAASYSTPYFEGSYQGIAPTVGWSRGAYSVAASLPIYHLEENGLELSGVGDAMVHANADLAQVPWGRVGVMAMISIPTADGQDGLGMGHWMVMPSVWTAGTVGRVLLLASAGYSRALAKIDDESQGIGMRAGPMVMSIVDPMNMSELTWSAGADVGVGGGVHAGARAYGGHPIGAGGVERVIGAGRVSWGSARVTTGVELQAGVAGDPFTLRGVVDTALRF